MLRLGYLELVPLPEKVPDPYVLVHVPCMPKAVPETVIFPCHWVTNTVELTVKLTVPIMLPFESTCAVILVFAAPPLELTTVPLKTPCESTATVIVPAML
jgi:hypothetical protein